MQQQREWQKGPDAVRFETEHGPFDIKAVNADALYVTTPQQSLVVRGVPYSASGHFNRIDGKFVPSEGPTRVSARRDGTFADASAAAIRTITEIFARGVAEYVEEHARDLDLAAAAYVSNDILREEKTIADLERQLREVTTRRNSLRDAEAEIQARLEESDAGMRMR